MVRCATTRLALEKDGSSGKAWQQMFQKLPRLSSTGSARFDLEFNLPL